MHYVAKKIGGFIGIFIGVVFCDGIGRIAIGDRWEKLSDVQIIGLVIGGAIFVSGCGVIGSMMAGDKFPEEPPILDDDPRSFDERDDTQTK